MVIWLELFSDCLQSVFINPLTAKIFGYSLLEDRVLHKRALDHKKVKFPRRDILSLVVKGLIRNCAMLKLVFVMKFMVQDTVWIWKGINGEGIIYIRFYLGCSWCFPCNARRNWKTTKWRTKSWRFRGMHCFINNRVPWETICNYLQWLKCNYGYFCAMKPSWHISEILLKGIKSLHDMIW